MYTFEKQASASENKAGYSLHNIRSKNLPFHKPVLSLQYKSFVLKLETGKIKTAK